MCHVGIESLHPNERVGAQLTWYVQCYIRVSPVVEPLGMFTKSLLINQFLSRVCNWVLLTSVKKTDLQPLGRYGGKIGIKRKFVVF